MTAVGFLGAPIFQAVDTQGLPYAGGLVWCYQAESDVEKDMFGSIADATNALNPLPNPMTLNSAGRASIVYSGASKFILEGPDIDPTTGHGPMIWTADNVGTYGNTVFDPNGNIILDFDYEDDATNYMVIKNTAAGGKPSITTLGDEEVGLDLHTTGSQSSVTISNASGSYTLPNSDGPSSYVIQTDGAGVLSWAPNTSGGGGGTTIAPGFMMDYGGTGTPSGGWLLCNGAAINRGTNAALFTAIGTTWGAGDGTNTFNLPNFARRARVGSGGTGTGTLGNVVGNTGGTETVTLTSAQMPAHTHTYTASRNNGNYALGGGNLGNAGWLVNGPNPGAYATSSAGTTTAHNNLQPSAIVRVFIKT